jgi:hypothetical protein
MSISRYTNTLKINSGISYGTSQYHTIIRDAVLNGDISVEEIVTKGSERLDTLAGRIFGESRYWWVLAATSGIGWGMQVPPGTLIKVPKNLGEVLTLVG